MVQAVVAPISETLESGAYLPDSERDREARRVASEGRREPGLEEVRKEESRERHSSTFFHSAWRVKGIIPSTLHPPMLRSLANAISHAGLKHLFDLAEDPSLVFSPMRL